MASESEDGNEAAAGWRTAAANAGGQKTSIVHGGFADNDLEPARTRPTPYCRAELAQVVPLLREQFSLLRTGPAQPLATTAGTYRLLCSFHHPATVEEFARVPTHPKCSESTPVGLILFLVVITTNQGLVWNLVASGMKTMPTVRSGKLLCVRVSPA